jgi:hypothetical protein
MAIYECVGCGKIVKRVPRDWSECEGHARERLMNKIISWGKNVPEAYRAMLATKNSVSEVVVK